MPNGAGEERRRGDRPIFLQGKVGDRIAPSSVTFGDSFPPKGKPLGCAALHEKSAPNQGMYMGTETAPLPGQCATTAKTSEWERAGHKKGGAGGIPPRLFASGLSPRESLDPPPGTGREPTSQVLTCGGSNGTTCQGRHGAAYPLGECLGSHLGAQRPVAPPARRGSPFLPRNGEKEGRGQAPWTPGFIARLLPLARFGGRCL